MVKSTVPRLLTEYVYVKVAVAPLAIVCAGPGPCTSPAGPPTTMNGSTLIAVASPEFVTVTASWIAWPVLTSPGEAIAVVASFGKPCTVTGCEEAAAAWILAALFASEPAAANETDSVPLVVTFRLNEKVADAPPPMSAAGGGLPRTVAAAVPNGVRTGSTAFAVASPLLVKTAVTAHVSPTLTFAGTAPGETEIRAGACTTTSGQRAPGAGIGAPSLQSSAIPPSTDGLSIPGCTAWYVQVRLAVPIAPATSCGAGEETSCNEGPTVGIGNDSASAVAVPLFVATMVRETVCPTLTTWGAGACATDCRAPRCCTTTSPVAPGAATGLCET